MVRRTILQVEPLANRVTPAALFLDPGFGRDGRVVTGGTNGYDVGLAVAPDGGAVLAYEDFLDFGVTRLRPDGSVAWSVYTHITDWSDKARAVAVDADGRFVVAGSSYDGDQERFAVARYTPDGALDPTFAGVGYLTTRVGAFDQAYAVAVAPDGKIVVGGYSSNGVDGFHFAVVRYLPDGALDPSFGGDGTVVTVLREGDAVSGLAVDAAGGVVAVGTSTVFDQDGFLSVVRYRPDGTLDPAFDGDGKRDVGFRPSGGRVGVALDSAGRVVVGGGGRISLTSGFAAARYLPDGTQDPEFGTAGISFTTIAGEYFDSGYGMAMGPDGSVSLVGNTWDDAHGTEVHAAVRLTAAGAPDPAFDGDGKLTLSYHPSGLPSPDQRGRGEWTAAAVDPNGRLVAAGRAYVSGFTSVVAARFAPPVAVVDGDLVVNGTPAADALEVRLDPSDPARLAVGDATVPLADVTGSVRVYGSGGADRITLAPDVPRPAWLYGGAGNDTLTGAGGDDLLVGAGGDDLLAGGPGDDRYATDGYPSGADRVVEAAGEGADVLDYSAESMVVVTYGPTLSVRNFGSRRPTTAVGVESVVGSLAGNNSLAVAAGRAPNDWRVTGPGSGTLNGALRFDGFAHLTGGPGPDTFTLSAGGSLVGRVDGGQGVNVLSFAGTTDPVAVDLQARTATGLGGYRRVGRVEGGDGADTLTGTWGADVWALTGAGAGRVAGMTFAGFEHLGAGAGRADTFRFGPGASVAGSIDAVSGVGRLDYSKYGAGVAVNLSLGTATGTGGVHGITRVTGGAGDDVLVGDGAANVLVGGGGRDVLVGGGGPDTVTGGAGEDLLVGAATAFDLDPTGLDLVAREWVRTDAVYADRVAHLTAGGGLNGAAVLTPETVTDDVARDVLAGGAGTDWFVRGALDLTPGTLASETKMSV